MRQISPDLRANIHNLADAYMKHTGKELKTVSGACYTDQRFLGKFLAGECSITVRKYDQVVAWFEQKFNQLGIEMPTLIDPNHGQEMSPNGKKSEKVARAAIRKKSSTKKTARKKVRHLAQGETRWHRRHKD